MENSLVVQWSILLWSEVSLPTIKLRTLLEFTMEALKSTPLTINLLDLICHNLLLQGRQSADNKSICVQVLLDIALSRSTTVEHRRTLFNCVEKLEDECLQLFYICRHKLLPRCSILLQRSFHELNEQLQVLQILEILFSKMSPTIGLQILYMSLLALQDAPLLELSPAQCNEILSRETIKAGGGGRGTISDVVTAAVKSEHTVCRGVAYRLLGRIAACCYEYIGPKIVRLFVHLRRKESKENVQVLTGVLWDLLYLWPEYLQNLLLSSHEEQEHSHSVVSRSRSHSHESTQGQTHTQTHSLLMDLRSEFKERRTMAVLAITRLLKDHRLTSTSMPNMIRELCVTFISRTSLQSAIMTKINNIRTLRLQKEIERKTAKRSRLEKKPTGGSKSSGTGIGIGTGTTDWTIDGEEDAEEWIFRPSDMCSDDRHDFKLVRQTLDEMSSSMGKEVLLVIQSDMLTAATTTTATVGRESKYSDNDNASSSSSFNMNRHWSAPRLHALVVLRYRVSVALQILDQDLQLGNNGNTSNGDLNEQLVGVVNKLRYLHNNFNEATD
eukprot:gene4238-8431_t